ncbi:MAG TPA: TonB family protein [Blastocatellia bacterium]|nr:TonB family protein [Blastocatellia bacterium]
MRYSVRLKFVFTVVMLALSIAATARAQNPPDSDPRAFLEKARASMVVITAEKASGEPMAPGVGFFVGRNLIATDLSVVISAGRIRVQPAGQDPKVDVSTYNNNRLVTILTVVRADGQPLTLGDSDKVAVNDRVFLLDYSKNEGTLSGGIVTKLGTSTDSRCFQISAPITSSSRGAPVFNSKGEVIGIAGESSGQSQGTVMPVSYLTTLLTYVTGPGVSTGVGVGRGAGVGPSPSQGLPSLGPGSGEFGGGGTPSSNASASSVDVKPVPLNNATPHYTEEARRNNTQGTVMMRVLVGADGLVKQVRIVRGLPDGLSERAIAAARQLKFRPAMKDGQAVPYWVSLQMDFNLR